AMGLDASMGIFHVDQPSRDSLACDLIEPLRPQVDAYLLDWITTQPLKREWFFEQPNGNARLMSSLSERSNRLGVHLSCYGSEIAQNKLLGRGQFRIAYLKLQLNFLGTESPYT